MVFSAVYLGRQWVLDLCWCIRKGMALKQGRIPEVDLQRESQRAGKAMLPVPVRGMRLMVRNQVLKYCVVLGVSCDSQLSLCLSLSCQLFS